MSPVPAWSRAVDLGAVVGLVGLALLGLESTFAGPGYLAVGAGAAALGAGLALLTLRLPLAVLVATTPLVAILLGGPVALRSPGLGAGIPDLRTMADVMAGSVTGWSELLGTLPPVDLAGPPSLVPFLLGFTSGAVAGGVALRTRSAGIPVVCLLPVLVLVLLLRRPETGAAGWYPAAFAALAIAWMSLRGVVLARDVPGAAAAPVRGRGRGRVVRAGGAATVVVLAVLAAGALTSGAASPAGQSLRDRGGEPADVSGLDSPLRRFRTFTQQPEDAQDNVHGRRLLTVTGAPAGSRLRLLTLDRFDGREWRPGNDTMRGTLDDRFLRIDTTVANPDPGARIRVRVEIAKAYRSAWVPTVGQLTSFRFLFAEGGAKRDQVRLDLATSTAVVPLGVERGDDYEFTAVLPDDRLRPSTRPWQGPLLEVARDERVDEFAREVLASLQPPMRKVFTLARHLREQGRYSDGGPGEEEYRSGHDLDRLTEEFLLATRPVGNDEQYASAMAVLANRVGVPARVVVGAVVPRDGVVRGEDVHAWVELRAADGSWRTLATKEFMGRKPPRPSMKPAPPPGAGASLPPPPQEQPQARPPTPQEEQQRRKQALEQRGLLLRLLPWFAVAVVALLLPTLKVVRRLRRRRRGRASDRIAAAWDELVDSARDLGVPVATRASRPAQARSLGTATALAVRVDELVFASEEPSPAEVSRSWQAMVGERRAVVRRQPRARRLWAPFNPVTLVRRPGGPVD